MHRVLIVASSDLAPVLGRTVLWREGIQRIFAPDPESIVEAVRSAEPSLVVLESTRPEETAAVLRRLRLDPAARSTAIAVVTRSVSASEEDALRCAGATLVFSSQVDPDLWDPRLEELLQVPRRRDARIPVRFETWGRIAPGEVAIEGLGLNISVHGMLLEGEHLEVGTTLSLRFRLPGDDTDLEAVGQVVREDKRPRSGIKFVVLRGAARERIRAFVEVGRQPAFLAPAGTASPADRPELAEAREWEAELRASAARKAAILDTALDAIVTMDQDGRILEFNHAAERMFRYDRVDVVGRTVAETLIPPSLRERHRSGLARYLATGEGPLLGLMVEMTGMRADGSQFPVELAITPFELERKRFFTAYLRDITERKRAEALRETLYRVSDLASQASGLQELYEGIHGAVAVLMPADNFYIALLDQEGTRLSFPYFRDERDPRPEPKPLGQGLTEHVIRTGRPLLASPEVFERLRRSGEVELIGAPSLDWLGVPLLAGGHCIGVMAVQSYAEATRYGEPEKDVLVFLSEYVARAIEKRRAEEALARSERRLRTLIDTEPECVKVVAPDGALRQVNAAGLAMIEAAGPDEVLGKPVLGLVTPEHREVFLEASRRALAGDVARCKFAIVGLKGTRRWVESSIAPLRDETGAVAELISITRDVTERVRMEEALRESEERFRTVTDAVPALLYMKAPDGGVTFVNRRWQEFTGRGAEEAARSGWAESVHPEDRGRVMRAQAEASEQRQPAALDYRLRRADGEYRWVSDTAEPRFGAGGQFLGHVGSVVDITARKLVAFRLGEASERLHTLIEALPDAVAFKDAEGRWQMANRAAAGLFGLVGLDWRNRTDEQLATLEPRARETFEALSAGDEQAWLQGRRHDSVDLLRDASGLPLYFEASRVPLFKPDGQRLGLALVGRNATERRIAQDALQLAASVFEQNSEGIMITDAERRILRVNQAFTEITGYLPEEVLGKTPRVLSSGHHDPSFYAAMWQSLRLSGSWRGEIWNRRKNGELYPEWLTISAVTDARGRVQRYVGSFSDVAEKKRLEEERRRLALHDPLTGLANRALVEEALQLALRGADEGTGRVALFLVDLARFERINATLGFAAGDGVLKAVAERLQGVVGDRGTVGRWYGDEFAVVAPLQEPDGAREGSIAVLLEDLRLAFAEPFRTESRAVAVQAVLGVATSPDDGHDVPTLVRSAETALRSAKQRGPSAYQFHTADMDAAIRERLELEEDLRLALTTGGLRLHYQPLVDIVTGRVVAAEALLRWHHPERGTVPAPLFVGVAEESGMILPIGRMVLREACRDLALWRGLGLAIERVSVNVSSRQLLDGDFPLLVREALAEHSLAPESLDLEITETTLVDSTGPVLVQLGELRELGVRLSIDDFGTGFSSLSHLKRLPVHGLKIDRAFISGLPDDPSDVAIARAILVLARSLGLDVVAEGVETQQQARFLALHGCDMLQGHLYGPAVPAHEFPDLARRLSG
jgi:diguanylate cyclase (GGDEF)-like protein/PAS domain S-box-containing protein